MSQTHYIEYRRRGFWAYDVALAVFLKHLIDEAMVRRGSPGCEWLTGAISRWRITAVVPDVGCVIDEAWSDGQIEVFVELAEQACHSLEVREKIVADEITAWPMLDDARIFVRGASEVKTAPVAELGRAIISLVDESLPIAPARTAWLYGSPQGRETIDRRV